MLSEVDAMGITAILHLGLSLNVPPPPGVPLRTWGMGAAVGSEHSPDGAAPTWGAGRSFSPPGGRPAPSSGPSASDRGPVPSAGSRTDSPGQRGCSAVRDRRRAAGMGSGDGPAAAAGPRGSSRGVGVGGWGRLRAVGDSREMEFCLGEPSAQR